MEAVLLDVRGLVQGVGFRPFVYGIAQASGVSGFVKNSGTDVEIFVQGEGAAVKKFLSLLSSPPEPIRIGGMDRHATSVRELSGFRIVESASAPAHSPVPPDSAICDDCLGELSDQKDRRFGYEFTNCTSCGPRFSVLRQPPFDRHNTSFGTFPRCPECEKEYSSPDNRRFYAQATCCGKCGPHYFLYQRDKLLPENPVRKAAQLLRSGATVVVKGWGGMHIAVDATDEQAVRDLRKKLLRPSQPFAVMCRDLGQAKRCAKLSRQEERLLSSPVRPIVVADKRNFLAPSVSGLHNVGIMLPHSALQHLLLQQLDFPLVFTSANVSGLPMAVNDDSVRKLPFTYFLLHNLGIENRIDDSVVRVVGSQPVFLRRSRGIAPLSIPVGSKTTVLALGAEWQNAGCLLDDGDAFLTQHIGNCNTVEVLDFLEGSVNRLLKWKGAMPELVACDLHPGFITARLAREYAERFGAGIVQVQHHQAHMYGVMAEHRLAEAVGIVCDGVGYGEKGVSWGGEVFYCDGSSMERVGHLKEVPMPGGDLSAMDTRRMLAGFLSEATGKQELRGFLSSLFGEHELKPLVRQLSDCPRTSSAGRFLDAVSALLGVCSRRTYEGEPAMRLESFALGSRRHRRIGYRIKDNVVDTPGLVLSITRSFGKDHSRTNARALAYAAEDALACSLFEVALSASRERGCKDLVVGGGVFYNGHISEKIGSLCKKSGLRLYRNVLVPCGDGGVSFGQACFAERFQGSL